MILIFGVHGYMGSAIASECDRRGIEWERGKHNEWDGDQLLRCELAINAAAYIPSPTVDACKDNPNQTITGNVLWPDKLARACDYCRIPLIHLSTGCVFDEQREYSEDDPPTRGYDGYCGFYVGTKLLAERLVREFEQHYILRLRLPFDEVAHPRN